MSVEKMGPNTSEKPRTRNGDKLRNAGRWIMELGSKRNQPEFKPTAAELERRFGPKSYEEMNPSEQAAHNRKLEINSISANLAADKLTKLRDPENTNSSYNKAIERARALEGPIEAATDDETRDRLIARQQEEHDHAIGQVKATMGQTGNQLVGREEVMDTLHGRAIEEDAQRTEALKAGEVDQSEHEK